MSSSSNISKTTYLVFGQTLTTIITFVLAPYLARKMSLHEYGTFSQVVLIFDFVNILIGLGLAQVLYVFLEKHSDNPGPLLSTLLSVQVFAACAGSLIVYVISFYIGEIFKEPALKEYTRVYLPNLCVMSFVNMFGLILVYFNRHRTYILIAVLLSLSKLAAVFLLSIGGLLSVRNILLAYIIANFLGLIVLFIFQPVQFFRFRFSKKLSIEILKRSLPLGITGVLGSSYIYIAGLIISAYLSAAQYAIYRNGSFEMPVLGTLYSSFSLVFLPQISRLILQDNYQQVIFIKRMVINSTVSIIYPVILFFLFFHHEFITLYLSDKYSESAIIFLIINCGLLLRFQDYTDVLISLNKGYYVMKANIIFFVSNTILNIVLINFFGYIGCAISIVISVALLSGLLLNKTVKLLKTSLASLLDYKLIFKILIIIAAVLSIIKFFVSYFGASRIFIFCGIFPAYLILIYLLLLKTKLINMNYFISFLGTMPLIGNRLVILTRKLF
ncbi:MAG: oligosaccharide flippase family protein [Chitinophagaceae bacterium]